MAYDQSELRLVNTQSKRRAYKLYLYKTTDTIDDILVPGYFLPNPGIDFQEGDQIQANTSSGLVGLEITSDVSTAVRFPDDPTLTGIDSITFDTTAGITVSEGEMAWNSEDDTLDIGLPGGSILQTGQEVVTKVRNNTGTTLVDGEAVYITGSTGNNTVVARAQANSPTADLTLGIVTQIIPNGQNGLVTLIGRVRNFDTSAWSQGDQLWLSATVAGGITNVQPAPPNHAVHIGFVVRSHATVGILFIRIHQVESISELHDVVETSVSDIDILKFDSASQTWVNVQAAENSVQPVETAAFSAVRPSNVVRRTIYPVDTTSAPITGTMTGTFIPGDIVGFVDYASNFLTNNFTVDFGAHNFRGLAAQTQIHNVNDVVPAYEYIDATRGFDEISI